ncbi:hypothetical protein [Streptomyces sp. DSM 15324]|uniref:hypothetical protein n=1 Tax=Streptomyces sp. DSM 15324 TaxID=1739111 RepID=UPI00074712F5|nr:hypothetical protein [Streptomyces sp. DSM 15324]KUO09355.1 hypothetical protein AQJ58_25505 [Streptomyces sp. DSM 15324]
MSRRLSIDTDGVGAGATGLRAAAAQLASIISTLDSGVDAQHQPWGDDKIGQGFAGQWVPSKNDLLDSGRDLARVLESAADGIETMAKGFTATEDENIDSLRGLHGDLSAGTPSAGGHRTA